ncbi:MAG: DUF1428 domain-containing protein [Verrucomicrobiaceae bacterium]
MSTYTDGFIVPVPKDRIEDYRKCAEFAAKVYMEYGALEYREWVADDTNAGEMRNFPQIAGLKDHETVVLSWITFNSREHRDEVNAKAMADERLAKMCENDPPFDMKRMAYGGFRLLTGS